MGPALFVAFVERRPRPDVEDALREGCLETPDAGGSAAGSGDDKPSLLLSLILERVEEDD